MADKTLPGKARIEPRINDLWAAGGSREQAIESALRAHTSQESLLIEVSAMLAAAADPEAVLGRILSRLTKTAPLLRASIYLLDADQHQLQCAARSGYPPAESSCKLALDGPGLVAWTARTAEARYVPNVSKEPRYVCHHPKVRAEYAVPLGKDLSVVGVLDVESDRLDGIRAVTRKLAEHVASQVGLALDRSNLSRKLQAIEAERGRLQDQLCHTQKVEAVGRLAGGIAHDFNNLLGVIRGYVSLARLRMQQDDPLQAPLGMIEHSAERAADLTRQILDFARPEAHNVVPLDIGEIVSRVVKIVSQTFDPRIRVEAHLLGELPGLEGDPGQLELAILNICLNARDAMPEGGTLTVENSVVTLGREDLVPSAQCMPGEHVRIAVKDTGVGMGPQVLERIFEPFFTTKQPGQGSGLGLTMVDRIITGHGGFVSAESQVGRGSEFAIYLPVASRRKEQPAEKPTTVEHGTGTVLVVDDEPLMRACAADALQELGYKVLTAEDGRRACEVCANRLTQIDCVLLDMVMPGMSWAATLQALRFIKPQARIILSSGLSGGAEARQALEAGAVAFLGKPYSIETLAKEVRRAFRSSRMPPDPRGN